MSYFLDRLILIATMPIPSKAIVVGSGTFALPCSEPPLAKVGTVVQKSTIKPASFLILITFKKLMSKRHSQDKLLIYELLSVFC